MPKTSIFLALVWMLATALSGCVPPASPTTFGGTPPPAETLVSQAATLSAPDLDAFVAQLETALTDQDWAQVQAFMAPTFVIGYWREQVYPPVDAAQAAGHIRTFLLPAGPPAFPEPDAPLSVLVDNPDPLSLWAPELQVVRLVYSRGWGPDGLGEAILAIGRTDDGYAWVGVLAAPRGFARLE